MDIKTKKVMVVEDEDLLLQGITKKLGVNGFEVVSCTSGEQALDYLNSIPELPDIIWLDYHLKNMDGLEFMHKLRANSNWKDIPVIVVSNSASPEKVEAMLSLGAKKYWLKAEHRLDEIVESIQGFLAESKQP